MHLYLCDFNGKWLKEPDVFWFVFILLEGVEGK